MPKRGGRTQRRGRRGDAAELLGMRDHRAGLRVLGHHEEALTARPNRELPGALAHLYGGANERRLPWASGGQAIEDPVVGDIAIPTHPAFLGGEAVPRPVGRQGTQAFLGPAHAWRDSRGGMRLPVEPLAPGQRLLVEVVEVGEAHAGPEARLQHPDGALDLAFGLGRVRPADAGRDPQTGHKVAEVGVPLRRPTLDPHQDALHAIRQDRARRTPKILQGRHETADEGGRIGALGELGKAHPRVAQDGEEAEDFVRRALLLVGELAPVELQLLAGLRLIAQNRTFPRAGRSQRMHKRLELRDATAVAQRAQPLQHTHAVVEMILLDPAPNLGRIGIQLGGFALAPLADGAPSRYLRTVGRLICSWRAISVIGVPCRAKS